MLSKEISRIENIRPYKALVAASLIVPLLLFLIVTWQEYQSDLQGLKQHVLSTTEILHQHAENVFETHQLIAERISDRLRGLTWDEIGRSAEIQQYLKKIEAEYPQVHAIWLADTSGVVRNASRPLPASPVSVEDRDYFKMLSEADVGTFVGNIVRPRVIKDLNFNIVRRRASESGEFNGVIIITVFPEYFNGFWNNVMQKRSSAAALIRGDGMMLARAPGLDPNVLQLPPDAPTAQAIKGAEAGSFFGRSFHDGSERFYAFRKVGKYNAYLIYGVDVEAALQEWKTDLVVYGSLYGLATSALLLLSLVAMRRARNEQLAVHHWQDSAGELSAKSTELKLAIHRLQLATSSARLGVWDWDIPSNAMVWDDRMLELYGVSREDFAGGVEEWENRLHPEDRAMAFEEVQAAIRGDRPFDTVFRIVNPDGATLHIKANALVIRDSDGNAIRMIGINQDISESRRMEDEIRQSRDMLEMHVVERTHELALTINTLRDEISARKLFEKELKVSELTIRRLNRLYAVLSSTNQAIARNNDREPLFRELCRIAVEQGGFRLAWVGLLEKATGLVNAVASYGETGYLDEIRIAVTEEPEGMGPTGRAIREGTYCICNNFQGDPTTISWHERAIAHGLFAAASIAIRHNNEVIGALTLYAGEMEFFDSQQVALLQQIATDLSFALENNEKELLRRNAEQALLEETVERLKATMELRKKEQLLIHQSRLAAMGEMIGNIAHQWRQPLNTLGLIVQSMQFFSDISVLPKEELNAHVKKAMEVIRHMSQTIDDFRDFFKPEKEMVPFHVREVVTKTISLVEGSFNSIGVKIELNVMGDPFVTGFPNEYSQVLLNIMINARDALVERTITDPKVVISIREADGKSLVTVSDNAGGIPGEIMEKIFDPYFTTKGPDKGTGLGLYMAKVILEQKMKGKLRVSNTDRGAEFRMEV